MIDISCTEDFDDEYSTFLKATILHTVGDEFKKKFGKDKIGRTYRR